MKTYFFNLKLNISFLLMMLLLVSCQQEETISPTGNNIQERSTTSPSTPNVTFFALGTSNELYTYRSGPPVTQMSNTIIKGLRDGEMVLAIDIRPANRVLYGVTNMNLIYSINPTTGVATAISQTPFTPGINGNTVGFDFNPRFDRITIVTDKGQTLTISPTTGQVISSSFGSNSGVLGVNSIAYSNNFSGNTVGTTLYDIETMTDKLYVQSSTGSMTPIGSTGLDITGEGGFDISRNGVALGIFLASGRPSSLSSTPGGDDPTQEAYRVYSINLKNGVATSLGKIMPAIGIAIQ